MKKPRPYPEGHSREADEKLAEELLRGRLASDDDGITVSLEYPTGKEERAAMEALSRLLKDASRRDGGASWMVELAGVFDGEGGRRFVLKGRPESKRKVGYKVMEHLMERIGEFGDPVEAAIQSAMGTFGLSRKTVYKAYKDVSGPKKAYEELLKLHSIKSPQNDDLG